jgi:hypothetical protein
MKIKFSHSIGPSSFFRRATVVVDGVEIGEVGAYHEGAWGKATHGYTFYPHLSHAHLGIKTEDTQRALKEWIASKFNK